LEGYEASYTSKEKFPCKTEVSVKLRNAKPPEIIEIDGTAEVKTVQSLVYLEYVTFDRFGMIMSKTRPEDQCSLKPGKEQNADLQR
jgi:hypothetical protein